MSSSLRIARPLPVKSQYSPSTDLYVTDHPDDPQESLQQLRRLYQSLYRTGFGAVRYDWRWLKIEPRPGMIQERQVAHYCQVKAIMEEVGLGAPIIVLSSPPQWATVLYRRGQQEAFFAAYRRYVEQVAAALHRIGGRPIQAVQVLNELNNRMYTNVLPADIAQLCIITREVFRMYGWEVQLLATVLALPRRPLVGAALSFLRKNRAVLEANFDRIGVDYYPGTWHWPSFAEIWVSHRKTANLPGEHKHGLRAAVVGNTVLLEEIYLELAGWRTDYELAEVGWTSYGLFGGEAAQAVCSVTFLENYQSLVARFKARGDKLPQRLGVYMARDEVTIGLLRVITKYHRWGLYTATIQPKRVVSLKVWQAGVQVVGSVVS